MGRSVFDVHECFLSLIAVCKTIDVKLVVLCLVRVVILVMTNFCCRTRQDVWLRGSVDTNLNDTLLVSSTIVDIDNDIVCTHLVLCCYRNGEGLVSLVLGNLADGNTAIGCCGTSKTLSTLVAIEVVFYYDVLGFASIHLHLCIWHLDGHVVVFHTIYLKLPDTESAI